MVSEHAPRPDNPAHALDYLFLQTKDIPLPSSLTDFTLAIKTLSPDIMRSVYQSNPDMLSVLFTEDEIAYCRRYKVRPEERFTTQYLGKQAVATLLGLTPAEMNWHDIVLTRSPFGAPQVTLNGVAKSAAQEKGLDYIPLSLSHETQSAVAMCTPDKTKNGVPIVAVGIDVCTTTTFRPHLIEGLFTQQEIQACMQGEEPGKQFALYFAAKESVIKIFQTLETFSGGIWKQIELQKDENGNYTLHFFDRAKKRAEEMGIGEVFTSLSFDKNIGALAVSIATAE